MIYYLICSEVSPGSPFGYISDLLQALARIKRHPLMRDGSYTVRDGGNGVIAAEYRLGNQRLLGLFCTAGKGGLVRMNLPDGSYPNLLGGSVVQAEAGQVSIDGQPMIFEIL